ncbi:MFS transporter [Sphingosinicellaceae bacterium]|nr:MFS transporter [Sphingosinicellaceae bacterium]
MGGETIIKRGSVAAGAPGIVVSPVVPAVKSSDAYLWYVVAFLTVAATVSIVDRQILALMIGPVKRDLGVSDTMMGLLGGLAFTLFYTFLTLPMAWLADQSSRRRIIGWGIFFWSLATIGCGLASRFGQLFFARMCVGVGEATLQPAAISLMSDYFDRAKLPLALGIFSASPFVGVGLANILGGSVVQHLEALDVINLPLIGTVRSWQAMFIIVGTPGIVLALLTLTIREPARRGMALAAAAGAPATIDRAAIMALLRSRGRFLTYHFIAYTALAVQGWALFYWVVEFFIREHGATRAETGLTFGTIALVFGTIGSIISGILSGRMMRAGRPDATLRLVLAAALLLIPVGIAAPLVSGFWPAMGLFAVAMFFMGWPTGLGTAALQFIVPNELRGRIIALYLVVVNFLSYSLGPLLGGLISDQVFDGKSLGSTLALMAVVNYPLGAFFVWRSLPHFRAALLNSEKWRDDQPIVRAH